MQVFHEKMSVSLALYGVDFPRNGSRLLAPQLNVPIIAGDKISSFSRYSYCMIPSVSPPPCMPAVN